MCVSVNVGVCLYLFYVLPHASCVSLWCNFQFVSTLVLFAEGLPVCLCELFFQLLSAQSSISEFCCCLRHSFKFKCLFALCLYITVSRLVCLTRQYQHHHHHDHHVARHQQCHCRWRVIFFECSSFSSISHKLTILLTHSLAGLSALRPVCLPALYANLLQWGRHRLATCVSALLSVIICSHDLCHKRLTCRLR